MGQLIYAGAGLNGIPDVELAHLNALTRQAFSAGKSFMVVVQGTTDDGDVAAQSLWFAPQIPVQFHYEGFETVQIDRQLFAKLYDSAINTGVHLVGNGPLPYEFTGERPNSDGGE